MTPGDCLGPYEIVEPLGAGGMGEVWLATDTRLGRKVAIKVLPEQFASDPERRARFEQEARAAAALNHPNIAVVHDVGEADGTHFMVQEYLEGESLRERLDRGGISLQQRIALAIEVAEALAAAHRAGIVHRDLKPANVFVSPDEHAQVLDFGLAKLLEPTSPSIGSSAENSPTALATSAGMVMGTAGYMAPEQVEGRPVDGRSDVFAVGCLLYELASGRQPFAGDSLHETLHRIGHVEPTALRELDARLPDELQRIVFKCLQKEPGRRYQHADDLAVDLRQLAASGVGGASAAAGGATGREAPAAGSRSLGWPALLGVAALMLLAGLAGLYLGGQRRAPAPGRSGPAVRTVLPIPGPLNGAGVSQSPLAISPQGDKVVMVIQEGGRRQLFLRALDRLDAVAIPGTEGASNPFFAPDGNAVGYFSGNSMMRVSVRDADPGVPVRISGVEGALYGATWADDDTIYFTTQSMTTPMAVPASGGIATPVDVVEPELARYAAPFALPGGRHLLLTLRERNDDDAVVLSVAWLSLETGQMKILAEGSGARFLEPGYLVWATRELETRANVPIVVARFDPERGELLSGSVPLPFALQLSLGDGRPRMAVSDSGVLLYDSRPETSVATLAWADRTGRTMERIGEPGAFAYPRLSPDGTRVAHGTSGFTSIQVLDLERDTITEIPVQGGTEGFPVWSQDGRDLYILGSAERGLRILRGPADGSRPFEQVIPSETTIAPMSVGPDRTLFYYEVTAAGERDLWFLSPGGEPQRFLSTDADERAPMISPDGRYLAYVSNTDGRDQIYVRPWPDGERRYKISSTGGAEPVWSRDGRELFYRQGNRMYAVAIRSDGGQFAPGRPELLFEAQIALGQFGNPNYDVSEDGERFLVVAEPIGDDDQAIEMVVNWFEELESMLPPPR
jgi:predicted Ser/Thr protein kinase